MEQLKFLIVPFDLTNALITFSILMNKILYSYLEKFVIVYLDDIMIYSSNMDEHARYLKIIF